MIRVVQRVEDLRLFITIESLIFESAFSPYSNLHRIEMRELEELLQCRVLQCFYRKRLQIQQLGVPGMELR